VLVKESEGAEDQQLIHVGSLEKVSNLKLIVGLGDPEVVKEGGSAQALW